MNTSNNKRAGGVVLASLLFATSNLSPVAANDNNRVEHKVDIVSFQFVPPVLELNRGDTITWTNRDIVPHTATAANGELDTGDIPAGESRTILFESDSSIAYICTYHPSMRGRLEKLD